MRTIVIIYILVFMMTAVSASNPKTVAFHTTLDNEDIDEKQYSNLEAKYWIKGREDEIGTVTTFFIHPTLGSLVACDTQYFTSKWGIGDTLHIELKFEDYIEFGDWIIDSNSGSPAYPPATPVINIQKIKELSE